MDCGFKNFETLLAVDWFYRKFYHFAGKPQSNGYSLSDCYMKLQRKSNILITWFSRHFEQIQPMRNVQFIDIQENNSMILVERKFVISFPVLISIQMNFVCRSFE